MTRFKLPLSQLAPIFLGLGLLLPASAQTPPCKSGRTSNDAYMLRTDQKRCEGITTVDIVRGDFGLRSFTVGQFQPSRMLTLTIPNIANLPEPKILIQSSKGFYQLDPLELKPSRNQWQFQWSDEVLRSAKIAFSSLRSLAQVDNAVLPVLLSKAPSYDLRIFTGGRSKTIRVSILKLDGTELYRKTLTNQPGDEVAFSWNGRDQQNRAVARGRYTLKVEAQVEQRNAPPESRSRTRQFFHDPAWLK